METSSKRIHPSLPIFELQSDCSSLLYAPGHVAKLDSAEMEEVRDFFQNDRPVSGRLSKVISQLCDRAAEAEARWHALGDRPFAPECLTVYLSNHCNLACIYCYAASHDGRRNIGWEDKDLPLVNPEAVEAAARIVARNCAGKQKPFNLVLHGGGEPTLHWELLLEIVKRVRGVAVEFGLEVESYISTSGVLSEQKARWLADNISTISLSIDGPAEIQDAQRPLGSGVSTWSFVERTARVLRNAGVEFSIRTTITRVTIRRQAEILLSLHRQLGARKFTFEPAYRPHPGADWSLCSLQDAAVFVEHFLTAQYVAEVLGCELETSGVRLDEVHGPYCNVLRDVLQLLPDNTATSCFVCTDGTQARFVEYCIGKWDPNTGFSIDDLRVAEVRRRALAVPNRCRSCHNVYHCARDCPDTCPVAPNANASAPGGFHCEVQRRLGQAWILDSVANPIERFELDPGEIDLFVRNLAQTPDDISAFEITRQWVAARQRYHLEPRRAPDPLWTRGFDMDGNIAWNRISGPVATEMKSAPISIYVHIPFCDRKCNFCDCYSLTVADRTVDSRMKEYMRALHNEIDTWAGIPALTRREVTTVHLGGGTPTFLDTESLKLLVQALKANFNVTSTTDWAIESTSTDLTPENLQLLVELGFTHLHVGVQTLEDDVRRLAGRRESAAGVEHKLRAALAFGLVVTVDVIYGLPGETVTGFVNTLKHLDALGVHGFSLYKLNLTRHNQTFSTQYRLGATSRSELLFLFQLGESFLLKNGYRKSHFAHFSKPGDRYLYYTHVRRGEDLLALGASADGVFGTLHYRHPEFGDYTHKHEAGPVLAGATVETKLETELHPLVAGLMSASLPVSAIRKAGVDALLEKWIASGLLRFEQTSHELKLTATGSWLIGEMLSELARAIERREATTV